MVSQGFSGLARDQRNLSSESRPRRVPSSKRRRYRSGGACFCVLIASSVMQKGYKECAASAPRRRRRTRQRTRYDTRTLFGIGITILCRNPNPIGPSFDRLESIDAAKMLARPFRERASGLRRCRRQSQSSSPSSSQ